MILGYIVELFYFETFGRSDVGRSDGFGRAVIITAATDLAVEGLAPRSFAVFLNDEGLLEILRACFGGLPLAIRLDDDVLTTCGQFQRDPSDEGCAEIGDASQTKGGLVVSSGGGAKCELDSGAGNGEVCVGKRTASLGW